MTSREQKLLVVGLVILDLVIAAGFLLSMPSKVPAHWNWRGEVDRYGSPWEMTLVLSLCLMWIPLLMMALPAIESVGAPLARSQQIYGRMVIALTTTLVAVHVIIMLSASDRSLAPISGIPLILGLLWIALGNWMGKLRRNPVIGIRTPWTLRNDTVWERTHRLGGRLFVVDGLATIAAALLLPIWAACLVLIGGLIALCAWACWYSWWITPTADADQRYA